MRFGERRAALRRMRRARKGEGNNPSMIAFLRWVPCDFNMGGRGEVEVRDLVIEELAPPDPCWRGTPGDCETGVGGTGSVAQAGMKRSWHGRMTARQ